MNFKGTIIEESLQDIDVLKKIAITETKISQVTEKMQTPWLKNWTLHRVEVPEDKAQSIAEKLSEVLEKNYWYADYKNDKLHYIIFNGKIFIIDRASVEEYAQAKKYGMSLGIPEYQVDFSPEIK